MTDIIVGSRGSGKSTALLKQSAEEQIYILTGTRSQAKCLFDQAREMGLNIPFPVTWDDYCKGHFQGTSIEEDGVLIDEASHILSRALRGIPIKTVTWTKYGFRDLDKFEWPHGGSYELYPRPIDYQKIINNQSRKIEELEEQLNRAYRVIGQLVEKPNCFEE